MKKTKDPVAELMSRLEALSADDQKRLLQALENLPGRQVLDAAGYRLLSDEAFERLTAHIYQHARTNGQIDWFKPRSRRSIIKRNADICFFHAKNPDKWSFSKLAETFKAGTKQNVEMIWKESDKWLCLQALQDWKDAENGSVNLPTG
jgi:hypothetical protein